MLFLEVRAAPQAVPVGSVTNSVGMVFRAVDASGPLFSVWETRVIDFSAFVKSTGGEWERPSFEQAATHPAVNVSWGDASSFCRWLTEQEQAAGLLPEGARYRLPSSAEWDRAVGVPVMDNDPLKALPVGGRDYPWGKEWPPPRNAGNYHPSLRVEAFEATSPVGAFAGNAFGLHDLGGNAWEWCSDPFNNSLDFRVLRGASWRMQAPSDLLSDFRVGNVMSLKLDSYGFRPVLDLPEGRAEAIEQVNKALASREAKKKRASAKAKAAKKREAERIARAAEVDAEREAQEVEELLAKYQEEGVEPGARRKRSWLGRLFRKNDKPLSNNELLMLDGGGESAPESDPEAEAVVVPPPVETSEEAVEAKPSAKKGFFGRIFSRKKDAGEATSEAESEVVEAEALPESIPAGASAPVPVETSEEAVEAKPSAKKGFFGRIFSRKKDAGEATSEAESEVVEAEALPESIPAGASAPAPVETLEEAVEAKPSAKKGFFARIFSRKKDAGEATSDSGVETVEPKPEPAPVELAPEPLAEGAAAEATDEVAAPKKRSWLGRVFRGKKKAEGDRPPAAAPAGR